MAFGATLRVYRVVRSDPPVAADFQSHRAMGVAPLRPLETEEQREAWDGVSCWTSAARADALARTNPKLGTYIATLDIPVRRFKTRTGRKGHITVWGEPSALLTCVVMTTPVDSEESTV